MFATAMHTEQAGAETWNGARSYSTPDESQLSGLIKILFKGVRGLSTHSLNGMMIEAFTKTPAEAIVAAFNLRHCRGGKGERVLGRAAIEWIFVNKPEIFPRLIPFIPEMGRWDDLIYLLTVKARTRDTSSVEQLKDQVAMFYMTNLNTQKELMAEGKPTDLSAKWAPTQGSAMDKQHHVVARLCRVYGITLRTYRVEYCTPLRAYGNILERLMCSGEWDEIQFAKVPSCAMKKLKKAFEKHVPAKFNQYKADLTAGKTVVKGKQLFPHELVSQCRLGKYDAITQGQWNVQMAEAKKLGNLKRTVAMVDSSGSMRGLPMDVAFALGILIAEQTLPPFRGDVLTFESQPTFITLKRNAKLSDLVLQLLSAPWGGSTNIQAAFDLILIAGVKAHLPQSQMPDRLVIISDMQFNQSQGGTTNWEAIQQKYAAAGYERPGVVFWNVNGGSSDFPVTTTSDNVALVSGFSPALLKGIIEMPKLSISGFVETTLNDPQYAELYQVAREITGSTP